ncbi:MAG: hypothetical protein JWM64_729, partial [Frankiales bacterium]|nr:hypothetical protein [Frankiales bacterium]
MTLPSAPLAPASSARALQLDVSRRLDGLLQGDHLGFLPGPGSEPAEARAYSPGDDVRRIDWAVTARTSEVHVRDAVAERELETTLLVDLTASMSFGTARCEKREVAIAVAAAFAHLASGPGDRLGAVLLGDRVRRVRARAGRDASLALLHLLLESPRSESAGPSLSEGITACASPPRRRGLQVVVSDLLEPGPPQPEPAWSTPLRRLATRHEVVVVEVVDPRELALPAVGSLRLVDPESGRQVEVHTGRALRERYAAAAAARRASHAAAVRRAGAGHV